MDLEKAYDWEVLQECCGGGNAAQGHSISLCPKQELCWVLGNKLHSFQLRVNFHQGCTFSPVLFMIFMDRISKLSHGGEGLQLGGLGIVPLFLLSPMVMTSGPDGKNEIAVTSDQNVSGEWLVSPSGIG